MITNSTNLRNIPKVIKGHLMVIYCLLCCYSSASAQILDSNATGNIANTAEEYWPKSESTARLLDKIKHLDINHGKGWLSLGLNLREGYETFDNYLWGIGEQDPNGFSQHRAIITADLRWNKTFRMYSEIQSGFISGRRGGERPVQDLNALVVNQVFLEMTLWKSMKSVSALRVGKQTLSYGTGSLLDLRDINVRRSYYGYKMGIKTHKDQLDLFYMNPATVKNGFLDDKIDWKERIAGIWYSRMPSQKRPVKIKTDLYYLYLHRSDFRYAQGKASEDRHTLGILSQVDIGYWTNYFEGDLQIGRFGNSHIHAWKVTESIFFHATSLPLKPTFGLQSAISSGDGNLEDNRLETFSPLFPRGIYYGFVDNAGSSNLIVVHPKCDLEVTSKFKISLDYYKFWRFKNTDALYSTPGLFFLGPENTSKYVGWMGDLVGRYTVNRHFNFSATTAYYKRGKFLVQIPATKGDIFYFGLKANLII